MLGLYGRTELTSVTNFALTIRMGEKYDSIGSLAYEPTCNPHASLLTRGYRIVRTAPVREPCCGVGRICPEAGHLQISKFQSSTL